MPVPIANAIATAGPTVLYLKLFGEEASKSKNTMPTNNRKPLQASLTVAANFDTAGVHNVWQDRQRRSPLTAVICSLSTFIMSLPSQIGQVFEACDSFSNRTISQAPAVALPNITNIGNNLSKTGASLDFTISNPTANMVAKNTTSPINIPMNPPTTPTTISFAKLTLFCGI